jgi:hypothetical protein
MQESNILGLHHVETVLIYLLASTNIDKNFLTTFLLICEKAEYTHFFHFICNRVVY